MVFPHDVYKRMVNQKRLVGQNKVQLIIILFIVGNVISFFLLNTFVAGYFKNGFGVCILLQLAIMAVTGVLIFRFIIFDENAKKQEYQGYENDSFAKYMNLRKDFMHSYSLAGKDVYAFEYVNGSATCTLELKFGNNSDELASGTRFVYEEILRAIGNYGFESREIIMSEDFKNSVEFKEHVALINSMRDKSLASTIMRINDGIMRECEKNSCVDVVYLMIRTTTNYQKDDLGALIKQIYSLLLSNQHAFRSVTFLNLESLLELYRKFYGVAAIDLSMMKTIELAKELGEEFNHVVELYSLHTISGKTFKVVKDDQFKINVRSVSGHD